MPLPYFQARDVHLADAFTVHFLGQTWHLGPFDLHPFGILVATGTFIGSSLAVRRAASRGLDQAKAEQLVTYLLICGFIGAHVLECLMYRPQEVLRNPFILLYLWQGISSFGGFIGGTVGMLLWRRRTKADLLPYADQIAAVFPISWIFGRSGCSLAHDHVGCLSNSPLAFDFPDGMFHNPGPRLDLGFLELLITIPIAIFMWWYARKPRHMGSVTGLLCVIYAPIRFPLDALRATDIHAPDARYIGLTPAQWLSIGLMTFGVYLLVQSRKWPVVGAVVPPAREPAVGDGATNHPAS